MTIRNSEWEDYWQILELLTNFKVYIVTIGDKPDQKSVDSAFNKVDKIQDSMDDIANKED